MKISTMVQINPKPEHRDGLMHRLTDYARRIEAAGFPGIWVGDSLGRGSPTLDPLVALTARPWVSWPRNRMPCRSTSAP